MKHNSDTMFGSAWSWLMPLVGAAAVFAGVLWTTPPGFRAIVDVLVGSPRGPGADADAYALGSASSLALLALLVMACVLGLADWALRRKR
jgi:hypothetical protein